MTPGAGQQGGREDCGDWAQSPRRRAGIGSALGQGGLGRGGGRRPEQEEQRRGGGGSWVGGGRGESDSSRGWQRPREQDAGPSWADAAALCGAAGLGLGVLGSVSAPSDWRPGATAPPASIPGQGRGGSSWRLHSLWSHLALASRCHSSGFGWPGREGLFREPERGGREGAVPLPTPLLP